MPGNRQAVADDATAAPLASRLATPATSPRLGLTPVSGIPVPRSANQRVAAGRPLAGPGRGRLCGSSARSLSW